MVIWKMVDSELLKILACPICKSAVKFKDEELTCLNEKCNAVFPVINDIPIMLVEVSDYHEFQQRYFENESKGYDKYELENWRVSYLQRIFKALDMADDNQQGLYLDIGVGSSGYTVIEAAKRGYTSVGVSLSSAEINKANHFAQSELIGNNNRCNFVVCLAEYLPFKDNSFTKVSSIAVLEHIPEDEQAIIEISRVVRPGGKVFITVPNAYKRIPLIFWLPYYIHDKRIGHLRHYSVEDLKARFENYGFDVIDVAYIGHMIKIIQFILSHLFSHLKSRNSWLWWKMEEIDFRLKNVKTGVHLSLTLLKKQ